MLHMDTRADFFLDNADFKPPFIAEFPQYPPDFMDL